jgi:hypothetical protein
MKASSESGLWAMEISWMAVLVAVMSGLFLGKSDAVNREVEFRSDASGEGW